MVEKGFWITLTLPILARRFLTFILSFEEVGEDDDEAVVVVVEVVVVAVVVEDDDDEEEEEEEEEEEVEVQVEVIFASLEYKNHTNEKCCLLRC